MAAEAGEGERYLVRADVQNAGRGRRGRAWVSPPGNLYASLLLRPAVPPAEASQLSFVISLAVRDAVAGFVPAATVACKWPNDVLVDQAKVAGILLESRTGAIGLVDWVIVGSGINVANHPSLVDYAATSLHAHGATVDATACLAAYLRHVDHWYAAWRTDGFAAIRAAWLARAWRLGQSIRVRLGDDVVEGRFDTLDASGALVLAEADGRARTISAGDVLQAA